MTVQKFRSGAFVFSRTRGLQPRDPIDLEPLAAQHGIPLAVIPTYQGDRVAVTRAITVASRGLTRDGILLRPIKRTSTEIIYGIVNEKKDELQKRLDHDFEDTVAWSAEPDPSIVKGDHDVAQQIRVAYQQIRGMIVGDDWSSSITTYLESHDAIRMRSDGRIFWCPPLRIAEVKKLGAFLAEVGIDLILAEIEPETKTIIQDVASTSIDEELDRLQVEADAFDGKQKPSTYNRRLDEYQKLRNRAVLYRDALGIGADRASQVLDELEQKVASMLELRKTITIHRDGTVSNPTETEAEVSSSKLAVEHPTDEEISTVEKPAELSQAPADLSFAGARFTLQETADGALTYTSDDDKAKASASALESMGLAGKWQQAGTVKINIQNSGPPGAAVSLRIKLPEGRILTDSATSLASWGIELAA